jgi:DNA-binding response OmpR family regulator
MMRKTYDQDATHRVQRFLTGIPTSAIVIGDDDLLVRRIHMLMKETGYEVTTAKVQQGLTDRVDRLMEGSMTRNPVELMIVECTQDPWTALSQVETIRERHPFLPVILIGDLTPDVRSEARRVGVDVMMVSPPDFSSLRIAANALAPVITELETELAN